MATANKNYTGRCSWTKIKEKLADGVHHPSNSKKDARKRGEPEEDMKLNQKSQESETVALTSLEGDLLVESRGSMGGCTLF
jgi:hypothetical protein